MNVETFFGCGALLLLALTPAGAQQGRIQVEVPRWIGTLSDDQARIDQLAGSRQLSSRLIRPLERDSVHSVMASGREGSPPSVSLALFLPTLRTTYNSVAPWGRNDGAMWAGKGISMALEGGLEARWRWLSARFVPTLSWSQNQTFELGELQFSPPANASPYADFWNSAKIDRPQRFGANAFADLSLGQSLVRADWRALAVGVGTESMWWGPGIDNALLMTNSAGGIPHAFVGTGSPVDVRIGKFELLYVFARLYDSDYWRTGTEANRDRRWLGGLAATFSPRGAPGLYLGGGRVFYQYIPPDGIGFGDIVDVLQPLTKSHFSTPDNPGGEDVADQLIALFARWVFPGVGFEIYGEWGRNDHSRDTEDLILEPEHGTATIIGFQKLFQNKGRTLRVRGEVTDLAERRTIQIRAGQSWYIHHIVRQGYTHRGQLLGAGIGPGSNMQSFAADWQTPRWTLGSWIERTRIDDDAFYRRYAPHGNVGRRVNHDVVLLAGLKFRREAAWAAYETALARAQYFNRYTNPLNDQVGLRVEARVELRRR